jgi:putative transposase
VKPLTELPDKARDQASDRFQMLRPHLEDGLALRAVAQDAGVPFRTAQRWVAQYHKHGLAGLARKERQDRGSRRTVSPRLLNVIEGLALERPRLPMRSISRQVGQLAELLGEAKPSYWMVCDIVRELPKGLVTLAHEGGKVYSEAFDLVHRREATGPNAIWQADHTQLNILVSREGSSAAKPWLTVVLDDYSRAVAGYYLAFDPPSALRTSLALRQAIWRKEDPRWVVCGIPEMLYTDNGTDFTSRHMEQVAADLKMRLSFSIPGKPRGRGRIERFFKTVEEMFLCDQDGYLLRSRRKPSLTLAQLEQQFRTFLLQVYHRTASAGIAGPPIERWESQGFVPRMPESLEQLDLLLMYAVRSRRVRPDGIHFERLRYLSPTLAAYVGEEVTVRYDPRDMGEIRVFYQDKFLCRAISADLAGEAVPLREILRARNQRRQQLRTALRDRQQAVDTLLEMRRGSGSEETHVKPSVPARPCPPALRRYRNE